MHIHPLRELDTGSERLLRARAEHRGHDPEESVTNIRAALEAGRIKVISLLGDDDIVHGIAAWRWLDHEETHAQVLFLHTPSEAPSEHSGLLADHIMHTLMDAPDLRVIEARLRDESPGARGAWREHGFAIFERCRVRRALGRSALLPIIPIPSGYSIVPWEAEHDADAEAVAMVAHTAGVEPIAVPNMMQHHAATLRTARNGSGWIPEASSIAYDKRSQVVGYIAVVRSNGEAFIVDLAVHPAHQKHGVASALVIRALRTCLHQEVPALTAVFTRQNPIQVLFNQLSFQPTDCGQIAIWWRDWRQLKWQS